MNKAQLVLVMVTAALAATLLLASLYLGGGGEEDAGLDVVASFYPLAYMAEEIGGERVDVECLIPYNTEVHSWQPSPSDIMAADDADVILYNGAGLDHWFDEDILPALGERDRVISETTEGIELLEKDSTRDHDHAGTDPHTWLSPYNALRQAENIYNALLAADPDGGGYYAERWGNLSERLNLLDSRYMSELSGMQNDTVIVAHGAYGYLEARYGFEQVGIIGLSADEQPSTQAIADIAEIMDGEQISTIYVDPIYSDAYVRTLKTEMLSMTGTDVTVLRLYLALGPTDGLDYVQQLGQNLENLKRGLMG